MRIGRIRYRPLAAPALDHPGHVTPGIGDGVAGKRERFGCREDLGVGPATRYPVTDQAEHVVMPVIACPDGGHAGLDADCRRADRKCR